MKELDFDELDRAVNSLMTDVPKTDPLEEDTVKTLTIPSSTSSDTAAAPDPVPVSTTPSTPPVAALPPSVAGRRGGRFMDVVHRSSDMTRSERPQPPSRQGVTITPPASTRPPAEEPTSPADLATEQSSQPTPTAAVPSEPASSEWPDPLELADLKNKTELTTQATDVATSQSDQTAEKALEQELAPLTSPFLPDTKVEKRPLGGPTTASDDHSPLTPNVGLGKEDLTADDAGDQLPARPVNVDPQLPEELQGDLVAIESGTGKAASADTLPTHETPRPDSHSVALLPATTDEPKDRPTTPPGPASIPQQYREEPSTGDASSGAIYDTNTYHQPLAHPGKQKSGWLWVVWIVLILVAGAGVGAALYFLGIV